MFSSLTSFLPTSLRDTQKAVPLVQHEEEEQLRLEAPHPSPEQVAEEKPQPPQKRKRGRERRHANEVFVIVRPPPSKSNHPLNLQVQLVPPYSKSVLPRSSTEFDSNQSSRLYRSPSNHSQESSTTYDSVASFSSTASGVSTATSSTSSTRRAIVPLYNLQAHNVLPNVIVDAGTDAKVAKFQKRGIELVDLAFLEPVEVWPDPNAVVMPVAVTATTLSVPIVGPEASTSTLGRLSVDEIGFAQISSRAGATSGRSVAAFLVAPVGSTGSRPTTPDVPALTTATSSSSSLPSASHQTKYPEFSASPEPQYMPPVSDALSPSGGKRNIFGKIFKKSGKEGPTAGSSTQTPPQSALNNANKRQSHSGQNTTLLQSPPVRRETNTSYDQSHTPTQMQHTVTPTPPQHPYLTSKATSTSVNNKRSSGIRGSWLLGSPSSIKSPTQPSPSPLAAAFSSLGMKRRSTLHPGQEADGRASISLNEGQDEIGTPSQPTSAHVLASVPQSNQAQPQLSHSVLGVQPTLCVVPSSVVSTSRSYNRYKSRSPDNEASRSVERNNGNDIISGGKAMKDKEDKRGKVLRRVYMYVWLARKWMKRRPSPPQEPNHKQEHHSRFGLSLGSGRGLGIDTTWVHSLKGRELGVEETVEVRFEWKRGSIGTNSKKKQDDASNEGAAAAGVEEEAEDQKRRSWRGEEGRRSQSRQREEAARRRESIDDGNVRRNRKHSTSSISSARAAVKRWSLLSHQSRSTGGASEGASGDGDSGNESDPEDSETPWICTLKVRRTNIAAAKETGMNFIPSRSAEAGAPSKSERGNGDTAKSPEDKLQDVLKIKVGTLWPTPHHPKVVAMLKVPFPLPDVQIERLEVVKRRGLGPSPQSGAVPDEKVDDYYGLTLTAEEIKDIVCSTSLWLVARENIGGVGKVQRKGDGWMIRS